MQIRIFHVVQRVVSVFRSSCGAPTPKPKNVYTRSVHSLAALSVSLPYKHLRDVQSTIGQLEILSIYPHPFIWNRCLRFLTNRPTESSSFASALSDYEQLEDPLTSSSFSASSTKELELPEIVESALTVQPRARGFHDFFLKHFAL